VPWDAFLDTLLQENRIQELLEHSMFSTDEDRKLVLPGHIHWVAAQAIQVGLGQISAIDSRLASVPVLFEHFTEEYEYCLFPRKFHNNPAPPTTTSHEWSGLTWVDFSPRIFEDIRQMFGQSHEIYVSSLGTDDVLNHALLGSIGPPLRDVVSTSRSGSIFFTTADQRYYYYSMFFLFFYFFIFLFFCFYKYF
jgi:hypothetical protein